MADKKKDNKSQAIRGGPHKHETMDKPVKGKPDHKPKHRKDDE